MISYKNYSKFYDAVEGDKSDYIDFLVATIKKFNPHAKSVLELGCGTGYVLQGLIKNGFVVDGIDNSKHMLSEAKKKSLGCKLYKQDIESFNTNKKYDVVLCLYDTYNHLLNIKSWDKSFSIVQKHLNTGGLFLFDINSVSYLNEVVEDGKTEIKFGKNKYVIDPKFNNKNVYTWNISIIENKNGKSKVYKDTIKELGVEVEDVLVILSKYFDDIKVFDGDDYLLKNNADRVYFACKV